MNKKISFPIAIIIIVFCAVLTGIVIWQYRLIPEIEIPPLTPLEKPPEEVAPGDETADWKTYRNEEYGFEMKYSPKYKIFDVLYPGSPYDECYEEPEECEKDYEFYIIYSFEECIIIANIEEEKIAREKGGGEAFSTFEIWVYTNDKNLNIQEWFDENLIRYSEPEDFNKTLVDDAEAFQFTEQKMRSSQHTLIKKDNIIIDIVGEGIEEDLYNQTLFTFRFLE